MSEDIRSSIFIPEDYKKERYQCEYLVIGTGAGGAVAGALLAERGRDVIFLEDGGYYPPESCNSCISEMTTKLYRNGGVFPFIGRPSLAFAEGRCVGGGTVINGAQIGPTPPWILEEWEEVYGLHGYDEYNLKKYFELIERDLHVHKHEFQEGVNIDSLKLLNASEELGWRCVLATRAVKDCQSRNLCPTGCPSGAKQSMLVTYLPRAVNNGAHIFSGCRAVRIIHSGQRAKKVIASISGSEKRHIEISFDNLFIAGGAVQTPHLIRRSGISSLAGRTLQFHMTLKVVGVFKDEINAEKGTMFAVQVQEFEHEGILIMTSNLRPHYIAMTLSHYSNDIINSVLKRYQKTAIFAVMIRPKSIARIISILGDHPLVVYRFDPSDLPKIKNAMRRTAQLLFQAGATEIFMPFIGCGGVRSLRDLERLLERVKPREIEVLVLHVMASCPMGVDRAKSVINPDGRLWNFNNVFLTDASVLPSNIGKNPQGTIMAFAHEIVNRHLER